MKYSIHDLSYEQLGIAIAALNDTSSDTHAPAAPTPPVEQAAPAAPMPPVEQAAPAAPTPPVEQANDADEVDAAGIRWDERIHAGTKKKTASGMWKKRRGVDDALVKQVEAEQYAASHAPAAPAAPTPPVEQTAPAAPTPPVEQTAPAAPTPPVEQTAPAINPAVQLDADQITGAQPQAPQAPQAPAPTGVTHQQMMQQVSNALADPNNPVNATDLPNICQEFGITTFTDPACVNDPAKIAAIYQRLGGQ